MSLKTPARRAKEAARNENARKRQEPLRFMGGEYENREQLARFWPAFAGDDSIRAIRDGCTTVMEVERYCWKRKNAAYLKSKAAAQRSQYGAMHALPKKRGRGKSIQIGKGAR